MRITDAVCVGVSRLAACPVDERANSDSSDDDVAHMRVTIFLTLDRAGRVKAEVQEVVKAGDHLEVDNTAKTDALTACDTSGTEDIELTPHKCPLRSLSQVSTGMIHIPTSQGKKKEFQTNSCLRIPERTPSGEKRISFGMSQVFL